MLPYRVSELENGLTLVTETISGFRSVALGYWVAAGSRFESSKLAGISHFIEHMLFKGTSSRTAQDISQAFESLGAELNAFTTKEFTCFYTRLVDEHLETGMEVLSDMLSDPLFLEEHLASEKQVVLEEIAMYEDTPDEQVHDLFTKALWPEHPLGKQVIGSSATISALGREDVLSYFGAEYGPPHAVLAMAGNASHERMAELASLYYKPAGAAQKRVSAEPKVAAQGGITVHQKDTEQAHVCLGVPCMHANHPDRFALSILENILGGGMSSRLFQKIREERGLAYAVYSYHTLYADTGCLVIYAGTRPSNLSEVTRIVADELESIRVNGVEEAEVERCREQIKGQLLLSLESTRHRMSRIGKSVVGGGELLSPEELVERVQKVDQAKVRQIAQEIFRPERIAATVIGPVDEEVVASALRR